MRLDDKQYRGLTIEALIVMAESSVDRYMRQQVLMQLHEVGIDFAEWPPVADDGEKGEVDGK